MFRHNQLGSVKKFKGMSYHSRLISDRPGRYEESSPGRDIRGSIGSEPATGVGALLTGNPGNRKTAGLTVFYNGERKTPGKIVGYVQVVQNGMIVPLDLENQRKEILSIPALQPDKQAMGVSNYSGFLNLQSIKVRNDQEKKDTIRLINHALSDSEKLMGEFKGKENEYVDVAIELLRTTMKPQSAGLEILSLSQEKAGEMATQLKSMLNPSVVIPSMMLTQNKQG